MGTRVMAKAKGEEWFDNVFAMTDESGAYRIENLRPGPVEVELTVISQSGNSQQSRQAQLVGGQTATVNFDVTASNSGVEGYVKISPFIPVYVAINPAEKPDEEDKTLLQPDNRGYYRMDFPPGTYQVALIDMIHPEHVYGAETVEVPATGYARQDFSLPSGSAEGAVGGLREGEKAFVALFPGTTDFSALTAALGAEILESAEVFPGGTYNFRDLVAAPYVIAAVAVPADTQADETSVLAAVGKGRYAAVSVEIVPDQTATVDLVLP
jgi:hypothetical protein